MDNKNGFLTISEFAKLRGVTSETLRHYDRTGLLKPVHIDEQTGYRYYSILQYEQLGTIKELRQLGFSIDAISEYFKERNVAKSIEMLDHKHTEILSKQKELNELERVLRQKLDYLHEIQKPREEMTPHIVSLPERYCITNKTIVDNSEALGMSYTLLEKKLSDLSPILATNRMGHFLPLSHSNKLGNEYIPFIFAAPDSAPEEYSRSFPAGDYVTVFSSDGLEKESYRKCFARITEYMEENDLVPADNYVICYFPIDLTITDREKEFSIEMQLRVKKKC